LSFRPIWAAETLFQTKSNLYVPRKDIPKPYPKDRYKKKRKREVGKDKQQKNANANRVNNTYI
jgi:hypothetical protein